MWKIIGNSRQIFDLFFFLPFFSFAALCFELRELQKFRTARCSASVVTTDGEGRRAVIRIKGTNALPQHLDFNLFLPPHLSNMLSAPVLSGLLLMAGSADAFTSKLVSRQSTSDNSSFDWTSVR